MVLDLPPIFVRKRGYYPQTLKSIEGGACSRQLQFPARRACSNRDSVGGDVSRSGTPGEWRERRRPGSSFSRAISGPPGGGALGPVRMRPGLPAGEVGLREEALRRPVRSARAPVRPATVGSSSGRSLTRLAKAGRLAQVREDRAGGWDPNSGCFYYMLKMCPSYQNNLILPPYTASCLLSSLSAPFAAKASVCIH